MEDFSFLSFDGLNELQVTDLKDLLNNGNPTDKVEFPWSNNFSEDTSSTKGSDSLWNVHAPVFESSALKNHTQYINEHIRNESYSSVPFTNPELLKRINSTESPDANCEHFIASDSVNNDLLSNRIQREPIHSNEFVSDYNYPYDASNVRTNSVVSQSSTRSFNDSESSFSQRPSQIKLNPSASSFIPQRSHLPISNGIKTEQTIPLTTSVPAVDFQNAQSQDTSIDSIVSNGEVDCELECENEDSVEICEEASTEPVEETIEVSQPEVNKDSIDENSCPETVVTPSPRSWADVLKTGGSSVNSNQSKKLSSKTLVQNGDEENKVARRSEINKSVVSEDKLAQLLGRHLNSLKLDFRPVFLQPRGLINSRNWCYINATLQALLACPPFYTLLRNLPIGIAVDRGRSSTPVIDSMVKLAYELTAFNTFQEDMQPGVPFAPKHFYEMLGDLKSDCLKGQQEDAEEILSYILNGMHEEMVALLKNYEKDDNVNAVQDSTLNGCADASDGEDDWQVIGNKQKGMVTRKVVEQKTPISDLLGGQIKSVLTITGSKPSASIQPFFTLQLDIQSENVTSVMEALDQLTVREPIQGYTCAKTKQEVEAYNRVALQKLPPILILHLKRFVYNKTGGCKKVMKQTEYPIKLELKRDLFSTDVRKTHRQHYYTLFAVMYHDGEEAVKGHYISDIYNHTLKSWIRCDDRAITNVTEDQVLSYSPPRVPYLLFYQVSDNLNLSSLSSS